MKRKVICKWFFFLVLLAVACAVIFYHQVIRPRRIVHNLWQEEEERSDEELRGLCHAAIRWSPDHDSHLYLNGVGDESSIPYLIRSLGRMEGDYMCTKDHCIEALQKITGEDFGADVEAWQRWADRR